MNIEELSQILNNKKNSLQDRKNLAYMNGNLDEFYRLEKEIEEVDQILVKLNS